MSDEMKQAWSDVGERFSSLGRTLSERSHDSPPAPQPQSADDRPSRPEGLPALRDAVEQLIAAARQFGVRAAEVAHDDEVRSQAKQAAKGLTEALSTTAETITAQLTGVFRVERDQPRHDGAKAADEAAAILDAGGASIDRTPADEPEIEGPNSA